MDEEVELINPEAAHEIDQDRYTVTRVCHWLHYRDRKLGTGYWVFSPVQEKYWIREGEEDFP
jgi:hypothetical protein